jgi:hypothetical protein
MTLDKAQRSPRGLIENVGESREWVWPDESPERLHALLMDNKPLLHAGYVKFWRESARGIIEASGKNPDDHRDLGESEILDHVCAAARLMKQLDKVESLIELANRDPKRFVEAALGAALLLSSFVHQLAIADNETSIWKGEVHNKTLRRNAEARTKRARADRARYQARADELWESHKDWSPKDVATVIEREEVARAKNAIDWGERKAKFVKANTIRRLIRKKNSCH